MSKREATYVCREISQSFLIQTKNDIIQGEGQVGKNDNTWGKASIIGVPRIKQVNKAEELAHFSTNIRNKYLGLINVCIGVGPNRT